MRAKLPLAVFAMLVGTSVGEPVRWQDGSLTEATAWKFIPSVVELTTQDGVERVDPKKLHPDWLKFKFPHEDQIFAISRLEMLESTMLRQGGDAGYKLVTIEDDESPQDAIARFGLMNWPVDRILLVSFIKADQTLP